MRNSFVVMFIAALFSNGCRSDVEAPPDEAAAPSPPTFTSSAPSTATPTVLTEGTSDADQLVGSSANDIILGLGGADSLSGGDGDDLLIGDGFALSPQTEEEANRFLQQATFGPDPDEINAMMGQSYEDWITAQFAVTPTLILPAMLAEFNGTTLQLTGEPGRPKYEAINAASDAQWLAMLAGEDQLRQRVAFALSQILVISHRVPNALADHQDMVAAYMDVLIAGAFGNYRDLLEEVTYSPAMAIYLTYLRNRPEDPDTGQMPDENYAREIMQLFSIGLIALNPDGTPKQAGGSGSAIEVYTNDDVTGLAKVFTGLSYDSSDFDDVVAFENFYRRLRMYEDFHSPAEKTFLGTVIPAGTSGAASIDLALDALIDHPNTAPFVSKQLIQRLVTSNPTPAYVARVSQAFRTGYYRTLLGTQFGDGRPGDMKATIAAILLDDEARDSVAADNPAFGRVREPIMRWVHWARAFEAPAFEPEKHYIMVDASAPSDLGQHPFKSPSVFNFFRPGYVAPGTESAAAGMVAPELQITNASSIVGYANVISLYALGRPQRFANFDPTSFVAPYTDQLAIANDIDALLDNLDLLLTHGTLSDETRDLIADFLNAAPYNSNDVQASNKLRVQLAVIAIMTSPDYLVQR